MGSYEQWGDKAADFEAENDRFKSNTSKRQYKSRGTTHYKNKKKSGGFFSLIFKAFLIVFIIWFITAMIK